MSFDHAAAWRSYDCQAAIGSRPDASDEPGFPRGDWKTDFARHCVPLSEITSGGPRPDGIPPIDQPAFEPLASVKWLDPREPVIAVALDDSARAYPLHLGGVASPLDWSAIADGADIGQASLFSRVARGRTLTFTASGRAFRDDQTGSTWTITGEAVSGPLAGTRLDVVPHEVTFWFVWAVFRPETEIRR